MSNRLVPRSARWLLLWTLNYAVTVGSLRSAIPIWWDGGGPMPTLYWGDAPTPGLGEYYQRQTYFDLIFLIPYLELGAVVTAIEWAAAALVVRARPKLAGEPTAAGAATFAGLIAASALWDFTVVHLAWQSPTTLTGWSDRWDDSSFYTFFIISYGTATLLGGAAEWIRLRYC